MSFNRLNYDTCSYQHSLAESVGPGEYMLTEPPNVTEPCFADSPQIRLQQWGANLRTNKTEIEDDLRGQTRKLNRDDINENSYKKNEVVSTALKYESTSIKHQNTRVEDNRRDVLDSCLINSMKVFLHDDPQKNIRYIQPSSTRYDMKWNNRL